MFRQNSHICGNVPALLADLTWPAQLELENQMQKDRLPTL